MKRKLKALALALSLLAPATGRAQAPDAHAQAESQFHKGRKAMDQGDCKAALELFRSSQTLEPGRGKLLNMGICEERLGLVATALGHFEEVEKQLPADDDRRPIVGDYLKKLPPRVPHLRIDLAPGAPADATVVLDGTPLDRGRLGVDLALDPGKHTVIVKAPGAPDRPYKATLEEGKRATLAVEVQSGAPADTGPAPSASAGTVPKKSLAPAIGLGAVGVIGIGVGAAMAGLYAGKRSEAEKLNGEIVSANGNCAAGAAGFDATRCPTLKDTALAGDTFRVVSIVGFVAGGVAAAGAVGYLLFWPAPKRDAAQGKTLRFAPFVSAEQQGLTMWGSF